MPPRRSEQDKAKYHQLRTIDKVTQEVAADRVGISIQTARAWDKKLRANSGDAWRERYAEAALDDPRRYEELGKEAKRAYDDFGYFRRRYFGRRSSPWQEDAGYKFVEWLQTDRREFIVLNCPPGAGKSVLLKDIEAWLTCRNRAIRGLIGSGSQSKAESFARALKREFERTIPLRGEPVEVSAGRAFDALATLAGDFGRFQTKTVTGDIWRNNEFVVAQYGDISISEKESTWTAYGLDTDYIGNRIDLSVWDDVDTEKKMKTIESITDRRRKWDKEAETRVEPGGLLALVMQRKGPEDLSAHCLSKLGGDELDENPDDEEPPQIEFAEMNPEGSKTIRKYHHLKYRAHDDEKCYGFHSRKEPHYWSPDNKRACLLDPIRLPYSDLQSIQRTDGEDYLITYQQEDTDPGSSLVNRLWITGGTDPKTGEQHYGCYDKGRSLNVCPPLEGETYSILSVDPSAVNFWGMLWTVYHPSSEQRYMINCDSRKMDSSSFLDWDYDNKVYTGVLEEWWQKSDEIGHPIRALIFEKNAAQRYFGQSNTFNRWCALRGVSYYPHNTNDSNKNSKELGVQSVAPHFRYGRWRLPNAQVNDYAFVATAKLVDELCVYPRGTRTDLVMACWFTEFWLPRIVVPEDENVIHREVPQWMGVA